MPPWVIKRGDGHTKAGGGVNELIVAHIDAGMCYEPARAVSPDKEDHVALLQVFPLFNYLSVPGLLFGVVGQLHAMSGKDHCHQPGAVDALHGFSAHAMRNAEIQAGSTDDLVRGDAVRVKRFLNSRIDEFIQPLPLSRAFNVSGRCAGVCPFGAR